MPLGATSREFLLDNEDYEQITSNPHDATTTRVERPRVAPISSEVALVHLVKVMLGTGLLSLPFAFKHSGLWLGLGLLCLICFACTYCCRLLVYAAQDLCRRKLIDRLDYANVMLHTVEGGPEWMRHHGYFAKQLVNTSMFIAQLGFCCVYFVFMGDNLKEFFDQTSSIHISQAGWIAILLVPVMSLCTIRHLRVLAPIAMLGNLIYILAFFGVLIYLFGQLVKGSFSANLQPLSAVKSVGTVEDLSLFFGILVFAFEGIAVVLPIHNQMKEPEDFNSANGVLNTACLLVGVVYAATGFYGYLACNENVKDTITLNLPNTPLYQCIKVAFVACVLVSYPLQFYVPIERVEKYITRKVPVDRQTFFIYLVRLTLVIFTCLVAELIPHLALFISLIGAFAGSALALIFPVFIDILRRLSTDTLHARALLTDVAILGVGLLGGVCGTWTSLRDIARAFGESDI